MKKSKTKSRTRTGQKTRTRSAGHAHMRRAAHAGSSAREPMFKVRRSRIHGSGVFATRRIRKGTRVAEYLGERISHQEADARYAAMDADDGHTFLFVVDDKVCIDAGVDGNDARFINHSCDPNCESNIEGGRVFIDAIRTIEPGEELGYDYALTWESSDDPAELALFACRCGAAACRGTMLDEDPLDEKAQPRRKEKAKSKNKRKTKRKKKR
jgi:SET domain-containing protein